MTFFVVPIKGCAVECQVFNIRSKLPLLAGDSHSPVLVYSHAVIDIHVPPWPARRRNAKRTGPDTWRILVD